MDILTYLQQSIPKKIYNRINNVLTSTKVFNKHVFTINTVSYFAPQGLFSLLFSAAVIPVFKASTYISSVIFTSEFFAFSVANATASITWGWSGVNSEIETSTSPVPSSAMEW